MVVRLRVRGIGRGARRDLFHHPRRAEKKVRGRKKQRARFQKIKDRGPAARMFF